MEETSVVDGASGDDGGEQGRTDAAVEAIREAFAGGEQDSDGVESTEADEGASLLDSEQSETGYGDEDDEGQEQKETTLAEINRALKERSKANAERKAAREEAYQLKSEAAQMRAEAEAIRREVAQQANWLRQLRQNPIEAVRAAGWDPEQFIMDLAESGTPEHKQKTELEQLRAELREQREWRQRQEELRDKWLQEQEQNRHVQHRQSVESEFFGVVNQGQYPALKAFAKTFGQDALAQRGHALADEYRARATEMGLQKTELTLEDIADYLNDSFVSEFSNQGTGKPANKQSASLSRRSASAPRSRPQYDTEEDEDARLADAKKAFMQAYRANLK